MSARVYARVFVALLAGVAMATATNADTLYVPSQYGTIQAAIDAALGGDIVLVADGVYTGDGNRDLDFNGKSITVRSENGPEGCIIDCEGDPNDPHRGFYFHSGETDASVVDGFTVRNGLVDSSSPGSGRGGGICCNEASPTITNCLFNMNQRGGVAFERGDGPTITNCTFRDNSASDGGGLWINASSGTITITDCVFEANVASGSSGAIRVASDYLYSLSLSRCTFIDNIATGSGGGAVRLGGWGDVLITECNFSGNATTAGGALHVGAVYPVALSDCTFDENLAYENGGAVHYQCDTPARFVRCCFRGNMAGFGDGGAIYYVGDLSHPEGPVLRECTFQGNSAPLGGGGALLHHTSNASLINCTFTANNAEYGAAVANAIFGEPTFVNCTFSGNHAYEHGGGLYTVGGLATLTNCTLNHNSADHVGGGLACYGDTVIANCIMWENSDASGTGESAQVFDGTGGETIVNYSCVQSWTGALGGDGNFDADPAFVDPLGPDGVAGTDDDDLTLSPGSPCIDAGYNCALYLDPADLDGDGETEEFMPYDLAMNERFQEDPNTPDTGLGFAPIVDLGAYEFQTGYGPCEGDLNGDRQVDLTDLATLLAVYGIGDGGDLTCDGITDLTDLSALLAVYGTTCD